MLGPRLMLFSIRDRTRVQRRGSTVRILADRPFPLFLQSVCSPCSWFQPARWDFRSCPDEYSCHLLGAVIKLALHMLTNTRRRRLQHVDNLSETPSTGIGRCHILPATLGRPAESAAATAAAAALLGRLEVPAAGRPSLPYSSEPDHQSVKLVSSALYQNGGQN